MTESTKLCECGCGQATPLATRSNPRKGVRRGDPRRYVQGHSGPDFIGANNPRWVGGRFVAPSGYVMVLAPGHPRAIGNGYVREHILVVERALGKPVSASNPIHHVNEDRGDNSRGNLVLCQSAAYHSLLHARQRALDACGNAGWLRCEICKKYDSPDRMYVRNRKCGAGHGAHHRECHAKYQNHRWRMAKDRREEAV